MKAAGKRRFLLIAVVVMGAFIVCLGGCLEQEKLEWPKQVLEIKYPSTADSSLQPALFYAPGQTEKPLPLLVALHTWSGNYKQDMSIPYAGWCIEKGWIFIHPNFRGPNRRPQATGSELVVADIISAVNYAKANANVDPNRVYLVGVSGGGYTSLLMAGRAPHIWAGVSAWVPISDLRAWYLECRKLGCEHADDIVNSCSGPPGKNAAIDRQYKKRSPLTYLKNAAGLPLDINAGIRDGHHSGGVPISHSLRAFNLVAAEKDRISEEDIKFFVEEAKVPPHLRMDSTDPTYGKKQVLFRKSSGKARVTLFDGSHDIIYEAALTWLSKQKRLQDGHAK